MTDLVQHAAEVSAEAELQLLAVAVAARRLLDDSPDDGVERTG